MVDYNRMAQMARRLIAANGRKLYFYTATTPSDSAKPWKGNQSLGAREEGFGVVVDYENEEIDGQLVLRGDKKCIVNMPTGVDDPLRYVSVEDSADSTLWRVVSVNKIAPGSTTVTFIVQLRQ